jgi:hypothetical protein
MGKKERSINERSANVISNAPFDESGQPSAKPMSLKVTTEASSDVGGRKAAPLHCKENISHKCPECGKIYAHYASLHRHRKKVHSPIEGQIKCLEKG